MQPTPATHRASATVHTYRRTCLADCTRIPSLSEMVRTRSSFSGSSHEMRITIGLCSSTWIFTDLPACEWRRAAQLERSCARCSGSADLA